MVAEGSTLRAFVEVFGSASPAMSPRLRIHLSADAPPSLQIRQKPSVSARITPRFSVHSELTSLSVDHCYKGNAPYDYLGVYWTVPGIRLIRPQCRIPPRGGSSPAGPTTRSPSSATLPGGVGEKTPPAEPIIATIRSAQLTPQRISAPISTLTTYRSV